MCSGQVRYQKARVKQRNKSKAGKQDCYGAEIEFENNISENFILRKLKIIKLYRNVAFIECKLSSAALT